jgi:hypothetical protein
VYSPTAGYTVLFPKITGSGATAATNWSQVGFGVNNVYPILPDDAIFVNRNKVAEPPTSVLLLGGVRTTPLITFLQGGPGMFNFVSAPYPSSVVVSNLNLGPSIFKPATTQGLADNLYVYKAAAQSYDVLFRKISGSGATAATNWSLVGTGNSNGYTINLANGFQVQSKTAGGFYWSQPLPYTP